MYRTFLIYIRMTDFQCITYPIPHSLLEDQLGERSSLAETFQLHPSFIEGAVMLTPSVLLSVFSLCCVWSGLEKVKWSGRGQTIRQDNVTFYFDAAHNIDSIPVSVCIVHVCVCVCVCVCVFSACRCL